MRKCKIKPIHAHLGIFVHIPAYSDIFDPFQELFRYIQAFSELWAKLEYSEHWNIQNQSYTENPGIFRTWVYWQLWHGQKSGIVKSNTQKISFWKLSTDKSFSAKTIVKLKIYHWKTYTSFPLSPLKILSSRFENLPFICLRLLKHNILKLLTLVIKKIIKLLPTKFIFIVNSRLLFNISHFFCVCLSTNNLPIKKLYISKTKKSLIWTFVIFLYEEEFKLASVHL